MTEPEIPRNLASSGIWGGLPGRGSWRYPQNYSVASVKAIYDGTSTPKYPDYAVGRVRLGVRAINFALWSQQFGAPGDAVTYEGDTELAVRMFQQSVGSAIVGPFDGIVGPRTARALLRPYFIYIQWKLGIPDNLLVGQPSYEGGAWDPSVEGAMNVDDRGSAQINSKAHPEVSAPQAYNTIFAANWLGQQQARYAHDMGLLLIQNGFDFDPWDLAICANKGPSKVRQWAETGVVPTDSKGVSYMDYVEKIRMRAAYELTIP